mmetsp:Transcript_1649/g.5768  ORF Transcript_1649/g.5768 Transcript_1649/m.5768 type:complete len:87 (-) Transcript_1649:1394-1654(-)
MRLPAPSQARGQILPGHSAYICAKAAQLPFEIEVASVKMLQTSDRRYTLRSKACQDQRGRCPQVASLHMRTMEPSLTALAFHNRRS